MPYADPKKALEYRKRYYLKNKKRLKEWAAIYYKKNMVEHAARTEKWRQKNKEWYNQYYRKWRKSRGKLSFMASMKKWASKNYHKKRAQMDLYNAIRRGELKRFPCEVCGVKKSHAHHDDYSKPLNVRWLCALHHSRHHKEVRDGKFS